MANKEPQDDKRAKPDVVFTPANEPYLGRETVFAFDNLIIACLETNAETAPRTHKMKKTDLQWAACQLLPQGISIALSIRELVRQGHLFGALVLIRPLAERATTLLYLQRFPEEIVKWKRGWPQKGRDDERGPSLYKMLEKISEGKFPGAAGEFTRLYNSITHGNPASAMWSVVQMSDGGLGHAVSKILDKPGLCDKVCLDASGWLAILLGMMNAVFPTDGADKQDGAPGEASV